MTAIPNTLTDLVADPGPAADPSLVIARLNGLLRGEISAAETYATVLDRHRSTVDAESLTEIQAEHGRSSQQLRERITDLGGTPADSSGVWGVWAQAVQSTLSLIGGNVGSLRALREGEEHGQRDYETALNEVDAVSAQLIQDRLLPAQQHHLDTIDGILANLEAGV